jgi:hypothetical protein
VALCTRAEVTAFAKITVTLTADQESTIDNFIAASLIEIEHVTGPLDLRSVTYRCGSRSGALVLPWRYASVTSVTVDGTLVDASEYDDVSRADRGILDPASGYNPWGWGSVVTVVAQVGNASTPANVKLAALELCAFWWQQTQQAQRGAWSEGGTPMAFGMPQRVRDHLAAAPALPGFA